MTYLVREIMQDDKPTPLEAESATDAIQQYFDARPAALDGYKLMEITYPDSATECYWAHVATRAIVGDTASPDRLT